MIFDSMAIELTDIIGKLEAGERVARTTIARLMAADNFSGLPDEMFEEAVPAMPERHEAKAADSGSSSGTSPSKDDADSGQLECKAAAQLDAAEISPAPEREEAEADLSSPGPRRSVDEEVVNDIVPALVIVRKGSPVSSAAPESVDVSAEPSSCSSSPSSSSLSSSQPHSEAEQASTASSVAPCRHDLKGVGCFWLIHLLAVAAVLLP